MQVMAVRAVTKSERPTPVKGASRLLEKLRQFGLRLPSDLKRLAIARGCDYYQRGLDTQVHSAGDHPVSNAELAIALIVAQHRPSAREIRLAAALLGEPNMEASELAELTIEENCGAIVRYIARSGHRFEPENAFWTSLLAQLPDVEPDIDQLPHPTRFVEMTAVDRGKVGLTCKWIRPRSRNAS